MSLTVYLLLSLVVIVFCFRLVHSLQTLNIVSTSSITRSHSSSYYYHKYHHRQ